MAKIQATPNSNIFRSLHLVKKIVRCVTVTHNTNNKNKVKKEEKNRNKKEKREGKEKEKKGKNQRERRKGNKKKERRKGKDCIGLYGVYVGPVYVDFLESVSQPVFFETIYDVTRSMKSTSCPPTS